MSSYQNFKSFYQSNLLLFIILLFIIVYIIINWTNVYNGNYFNGKYTKPILITGIIFLISHMLITWDDNALGADEEIVDIPKYKFQNDFLNGNGKIKNDIIGSTVLPHQNILNEQTVLTNPPALTNPPTLPNLPALTNPPTLPNFPALSNPVNEIVPQSLNSKYRIIKNYDIRTNNHPNFKFDNNHSNDDSRLSNRNIFISQKNSSKYGLKF